MSLQFQASLFKRVVLLSACLGLFAGCTASPEDGAADPSIRVATSSNSSQSESASPSPSVDPSFLETLGQCAEDSILQALPDGSTLEGFDCAVVSPAIWAAVRVKEGDKVYFLETTSGPWEIRKVEDVCSKPVKGIPKELLAYCPKT